MEARFNQLLIEKNYSHASELFIESAELREAVVHKFLFNKDYRYNQQLSNVFEALKKEHQNLLVPFYSEWINSLQTPIHDAFWRNSYRYFQDAAIPEQHEGALYNLAFQDFQKFESPIAIKAFAMKTCVNIAKNHHELLPELQDAIEYTLENAKSPGVKGRAKKMLNEITKILDRSRL